MISSLHPPHLPPSSIRLRPSFLLRVLMLRIAVIGRARKRWKRRRLGSCACGSGAHISQSLWVLASKSLPLSALDDVSFAQLHTERCFFSSTSTLQLCLSLSLIMSFCCAGPINDGVTDAGIRFRQREQPTVVQCKTSFIFRTEPPQIHSPLPDMSVPRHVYKQAK